MQQQAAPKGSGSPESCCQKGWHSDRRSCQAQEQGGCREELPPAAGSCGEGDATTSLSCLSLLIPKPQILSCLLTPALSTTPGLPPLNLYCVNPPNSSAGLKWVAFNASGCWLALATLHSELFNPLTAAGLESCTGKELDRKVHPH